MSEFENLKMAYPLNCSPYLRIEIKTHAQFDDLKLT